MTAVLYDDEPPAPRRWRYLLLPCCVVALLLPWPVVALVIWARSRAD
jgi:hypothetical protein